MIVFKLLGTNVLDTYSKNPGLFPRKRQVFGGRGFENEKKDSQYLQKYPSKTNQTEK